MKLFVHTTGPVGMALSQIAQVIGCEVVGEADLADEVLCTEAQDATDFLFSGKKVAFISLKPGSNDSVEALAKNERFKGQFKVFRITYTDDDKNWVMQLIQHWGAG